MESPAADLARRLADQAEAVCRHYLSNGRREGRYWLVGDVCNTRGRSLYVRLKASDAGAAGKWTDAATGDHGDLLDLIAANQQLTTLHDTLDEARRFLTLARVERTETDRRDVPAPTGSPEAARRLIAISKPIKSTIAQAYLHGRDLADLRNCTALRYHPHCWYRGGEHDPRNRAREAWPAMVAVVTDLDGGVTGAHRTWLDPSGRRKAPVSTPRRAMGCLLGHGVRFGVADDVMAAGEGIETLLSLRQVTPSLPMVAALSANHLAALVLPAGLRRLYIARDNDPAGAWAAERLIERAVVEGIEAQTLDPVLGDFNDDLRQLGRDALGDGVRGQLAAGRGAVLDRVAGASGRRWGRDRCGGGMIIMAAAGSSPTHGLLRGRSDRRPAGPATAAAGYFPPA